MGYTWPSLSPVWSFCRVIKPYWRLADIWRRISCLWCHLLFVFIPTNSKMHVIWEEAASSECLHRRCRISPYLTLCRSDLFLDLKGSGPHIKYDSLDSVDPLSPNWISIEWAVFPQCTLVTNGRTNRQYEHGTRPVTTDRLWVMWPRSDQRYERSSYLISTDLISGQSLDEVRSDDIRWVIRTLPITGASGNFAEGAPYKLAFGLNDWLRSGFSTAN